MDGRAKAVVGGLSSADDLLSEYQSDRSYKNVDEIVDALIRLEGSKNFASGLTTGL